MPSKDKFEKSLLLTLESQVKGIKDTLSKLKKYDKNLVQINKNQKKVYETARAMGGILRTSAKAATVAIGGLGSILKRTSTIMLKFENSTINAEGAIKRLEKAYAGIKKSSQNALLSIQDIASALTDFQNTDIAKALLVRSEEFTKGFANVAEMLTEGVGPGVGKELLDNLLNTFKDQIPILEKIAKAGGTGIKKNLIDVLEKNQWSGGIEGANTVDKILRKLKADANRSDMTKSITTWNDAMSRFGTAIENLEAQFAKTFGPDVATQIERVSKYASELMNQFKEWGGINTLADKLGPIIKKIIDAVVWLTSTFLEAGITGKTAMIGLGIAISSINFRTLIKGTAGLIANIGKAGKVSSGLSEALGLMGIKFADALSGLKNFGKGIKVLMMDPYILAFAAAAGSIAILIYKINELNKTTESADKAINKTH